jgi:phage/plasmid-associated DNA primase
MGFREEFENVYGFILETMVGLKIKEIDDYLEQMKDLMDNSASTQKLKDIYFSFISYLRGQGLEYYIFDMCNSRLDYLENDFTEIAVLFHMLAGDIYTKQEDGKIFEYRDNEWHVQRSIAPLIRDTLKKYFEIKLSKVKADDFEDLKSYYDATKEIKKKMSSALSASIIKTNNYVLDNYYWEHMEKFDFQEKHNNTLQFKNGYLDINTKKFYQRTAEDLISKTLDYEWVPLVNELAYEAIHSFFCKIQPEEEQRNFTRSFLRYCLFAGNPEKMMLCNIGYSAANGKSTLLKLHEIVLPIYTNSLDQNSFGVNCGKKHKYLSCLLDKPVRLAYIEELSQDKLDVDFLKKFVDADMLDLEQLFTTKINVGKIQAKLITTSNKDPNAISDEGLKRRFNIQHYEAQFVSEDKVDVSKHKYKIDLSYLDKFKSVDYKLAYINYLLDSPTKVIVPAANKQLANETLDANDEFKTAMDDILVVTNNPNDKIDKVSMRSAFESTFWKTPVKLNKELLRYGIKFYKDIRFENSELRGGYMGVRFIQV